MTGYFVDTSVLLFAVGGEHPWRQPCREFIATATDHGQALHASVELGQEFLFHRVLRIGLERAAQELDQIERLLIWHPFDQPVMRAARDLIASGQARGRDAVHAATAVLAGFDAIVTCDVDFEGVPGLRRIDPAVGSVS